MQKKKINIDERPLQNPAKFLRFISFVWYGLLYLFNIELIIGPAEAEKVCPSLETFFRGLMEVFKVFLDIIDINGN